MRPAVVISKDYNANDFIVAMITSQIKKDKYSFFIEPAFLTDPLDKTSEVRCDRIATVNRKLITKNISSLTPAATKELIQKITKNFT